jgi:predicted nucleic acid-binding protein
MEKGCYVDTCIYLNLWQKEVEKRTGVKLWKLAQRFFEKAEENCLTIYYSGFILKELSYILASEEFQKKKIMFESSPNFSRLILSREEFEDARRLERSIHSEISFLDIIHLLLARKSKSVLVTRDKKLIFVATKYMVRAKRPEEL